jgi:hypothetical protein
MVRFLTTWGAILALAGAVAVAQQQPTLSERRLRLRHPRPQSPADFAPDPPPIGGAFTAQPVAQPVQPPAPAAPQATAPAPAAPAPAAQQPSAPAEDLPPPTAPQVTYRNNLLTVQASNSTLAALLTAIRNKTGIQFEGLDSGASERVAISMGPAPEGEVLAAILGGSKFDYVVVERQDSPGTVQRVLLSSRAGSAAAASGATPTVSPALSTEGDDDDSPDEGEPPQDTPARPPVTQVQPQQLPVQPPQTKTPEQLLEELKRMQQQQQPQQPQPNAPMKAPPIPQ